MLTPVHSWNETMFAHQAGNTYEDLQWNPALQTSLEKGVTSIVNADTARDSEQILCILKQPLK